MGLVLHVAGAFVPPPLAFPHMRHTRLTTLAFRVSGRTDFPDEGELPEGTLSRTDFKVTPLVTAPGAGNFTNEPGGCGRPVGYQDLGTCTMPKSPQTFAGPFPIHNFGSGPASSAES